MSRRHSMFALAIVAPAVLTIALAGALRLSTTVPVSDGTVKSQAPAAQAGEPSGDVAAPTGTAGSTTGPTLMSNDDNYGMPTPPLP